MDVGGSKNRRELKNLIDLLRKSGVLGFKSADLQIELHPSALFPTSPYIQKKREKEIPGVEFANTTAPAPEDAALFWSSSQLNEGMN